MNNKGEVIGVVTAYDPGAQLVNFAVSAEYVKPLIELTNIHAWEKPTVADIIESIWDEIHELNARDRHVDTLLLLTEIIFLSGNDYKNKIMALRARASIYAGRRPISYSYAIIDYSDIISLYPDVSKLPKTGDLTFLIGDFTLGSPASRAGLAEIYFNGGKAYLALGDRKNAIADFKKSIELEPVVASTLVLPSEYRYLLKR